MRKTLRYFFWLLFLALEVGAQPSIQATKIADLEGLYKFFEWKEGWKPMVSAHRGGPMPGFPENCIPTFENILRKTPAILEYDVEMTRDGKLILMHDNTLDRTTNGSGKISEKTWAELQALRLKDNTGKVTTFKIPLFEEVLAWGKGKAIMMVDIKRNVPFEKVIEAVRKQQAGHYVVLITYSVPAAQKIHRLAPELMISVTARNQEEFDRLMASGIPPNRMVAFTGTKLSPDSLYEALHQKGICTIMGTMGNYDRMAAAKGEKTYRELAEKGLDILSTDRPLEAAEVLGKVGN